MSFVLIGRSYLFMGMEQNEASSFLFHFTLNFPIFVVQQNHSYLTIIARSDKGVGKQIDAVYFAWQHHIDTRISNIDIY